MATQIGSLKIGGEKPWKIYVGVGLFSVAVVYCVYTLVTSFGGGPTPPPAPVVKTSPTAAKGTVNNATAKKAEAAGSKSLDPTLRFDLLAQSEDTEYTGNGRNVFSLTAPPPPIPKIEAPIHPVEMASGPPPPPPKPKIMLTFYGYETSKGSGKRIFLINPGQDVFIAAEGDIVDRRYKVVKISTNSVDIQDILNDDTQTIRLTAQS
jgi:hypothetical protein